MKIDEGSINHNAVRLIKDAVEDIWEMDLAGDNKDAIIRLAYIDGIISMANVMKEVLNAR